MIQPCSSASQILTCMWVINGDSDLVGLERVPTLSNYVCVHCSVMSDSLATPWTVAHQPSLSMKFSR